MMSSDTPLNTCDPIYGPSPAIRGDYLHPRDDSLQGKAVMIAAAGDSITWGHGASKPASTWPSLLARKLGNNFVVHNLGHNSMTVQEMGPDAYSRTPEYRHLRSSHYDAYIWMLGTNDARHSGWVESCIGPAASTLRAGCQPCRFERDYLELIRGARSRSSTAPIFLIIPPPAQLDCAYSVNATIVNHMLPALLARVCAALGPTCILVDAFGAFGGRELASRPFPTGGCTPSSTARDERCAYFCTAQYCDPLHPSDDGYALLAEVILDALAARRDELHTSPCGRPPDLLGCVAARRPTFEALLRASGLPALAIVAIVALLMVLRFRYRPSMGSSGSSLGRSGPAMLLA